MKSKIKLLNYIEYKDILLGINQISGIFVYGIRPDIKNTVSGWISCITDIQGRILDSVFSQEPGPDIRPI